MYPHAIFHDTFISESFSARNLRKMGLQFAKLKDHKNKIFFAKFNYREKCLFSIPLIKYYYFTIIVDYIIYVNILKNIFYLCLSYHRLEKQPI